MTTMKRLFLQHQLGRPLLFTVALLSAGLAPAQTVVTEKSEVHFVSKQMNVPVDGAFKKFTATVNFDPSKLDAAKAQFNVDLNSIDLGLPEVNDEVKKPDWFNTAKFPNATFVSSSLKSLGGNKYEVAGKLTIKGVSKDVTAPFTVTPQAGGHTLVEGTFPIKRLDYKIGEGSWSDTDTVANEVQVKVRLLMSGMPAAK
jgi:polyisoprenoid-binding protein YceI